MVTIISRVIQYGLKSFWRNGWLSTATVVIMVLALMVSIGLILFNFVTKTAVATIQDKVDISVYFKNSTPEDEILNVKKSLENLSEVKIVEYVSTDQALEDFKGRHVEDETISQALTELNENPLEASLNIKAHRPDQYATIAQYLTNPTLESFIDNVTYERNQEVINKLTAIINNANRGGLALTIIMALVAGLVVFNTVRLAIYSNREEVGIMRAVGASNMLVRGPYLVEGTIAGVIAAVASIILIMPLLHVAAPYLQASIGSLDILAFFYGNFFILLGYQVLFGVAIGTLSSFIAVRRYLKN